MRFYLKSHYPLETQVICEELNKNWKIDGEIIVPFFKEGDRFTFNDIHYVKEGEKLYPSPLTAPASSREF